MPSVAFTPKKQTFSRARREFDSLLKHSPTSQIIKATFIVLGLSWLGLVWFWEKLPPEIPLLYSRPWGEEQLVRQPFILLLPGLSTFFSLINLRLASFFFAQEKFLSQLIVWLNTVVTLLAATTLLRILLIIT